MAGYYLKENACEENPDTVDNCDYYYLDGSTVKCGSCEKGYKEINNKCVEENIDNCIDHDVNGTTLECDDCDEGYYIAENKLSCIENPSEGDTGYVENCKVYRLSGSTPYCYECDYESNYGREETSVDKVYKCVDVGAAAIDGCDRYRKEGSAWECQSCKDYHYSTKPD